MEFFMSPTDELADFVLPNTSWLEPPGMLHWTSGTASFTSGLLFSYMGKKLRKAEYSAFHSRRPVRFKSFRPSPLYPDSYTFFSFLLDWTKKEIYFQPQGFLVCRRDNTHFRILADKEPDFFRKSTEFWILTYGRTYGRRYFDQALYGKLFLGVASTFFRPVSRSSHNHPHSAALSRRNQKNVAE